MMSTATELAYRRNGDIAVGLYWDRPTGELTVFVADLASGETFELPLAPDRLSTDSTIHTPTRRRPASSIAPPALYV